MLRGVLAAGGENGFNQAIELAADSLLNVKFIREKKLLSAYFGEIAKDSGRYWYTPPRACHCASAACTTRSRARQTTLDGAAAREVAFHSSND